MPAHDVVDHDVLSNNCSRLLNYNCSSFKNDNDPGDATWILANAFIIFTMQSGFGMLEAGSCSSKSETSVMIKNAIDIIFGSFSYYLIGYALSFGDYHGHGNGFMGVGILLSNGIASKDGHKFAHYFFQLSFATTATTIVSGAMAERTNLKAYMLFSFLNFFSYVFPAHWVWSHKGFLFKLGVVDIAGCGPVHIVGGLSALIATIKLKPRTGAFCDHERRIPMASPTNVVLGTFMLWWGWLGFNCGSTFGVSGGKWRLASKTAVITINGSVGGGLWAIFYSYNATKTYKGKLDIGVFTSGILAGLVSITGICAICKPWEALLIGVIGGMICTFGAQFLLYLKIDDPVCCVPVHFFCGIWGMVAIGIFGEKETMENISAYNGIIKGGSIRFLGYQILAALVISCWVVFTTYIQLYICDKTIGLRISLADELLGADMVEHGIDRNERIAEYLNTFQTEKRRREFKNFPSSFYDTTNDYAIPCLEVITDSNNDVIPNLEVIAGINNDAIPSLEGTTGINNDNIQFPEVITRINNEGKSLSELDNEDIDSSFRQSHVT